VYDYGGGFGGPISATSSGSIPRIDGGEQEWAAGSTTTKTRAGRILRPDLSRQAHTTFFTEAGEFRPHQVASDQQANIYVLPAQQHNSMDLYLDYPESFVREPRRLHIFWHLAGQARGFPVTNRLLLQAGATASAQHDPSRLPSPSWDPNISPPGLANGVWYNAPPARSRVRSGKEHDYSHRTSDLALLSHGIDNLNRDQYASRESNPGGP